MPRAGFTAIHSGVIRFGRDGRWYCDGEVIPNRAICRLYARAMTVDDDGTALLELGEDRARVEIEDTPWVVTTVDGDPQRGFTVGLNDETVEPLVPASLRVGADHVLYCRVKGGRHEARFLRAAYYQLMRHAEPGAAGMASLGLVRAARLLDRARQTGDEYQTLLTAYCFERFLYRLGVSGLRDRFVLKGAMLLRVWSEQPYRATRDLDLLRKGDGSFEAIRADTEAKVQASPAWQAANGAFGDAQAVAGEAEKKAASAEAELGAKRKPYDDDPLFTYLWTRRFGTSEYRAARHFASS